MGRKNVKRDNYSMDLQNIIGSALSIVGAVITKSINETEHDKMAHVKYLNAVARLLIHAHHSISVSRRACIYIPDLTPQAAELIKKADIDNTLFGNNLGEKLKETKALSKLNQDMTQKPATSTGKKSFFPKSQQTKNNPSAYQGQGYKSEKSQSYQNYRQSQFQNKSFSKNKHQFSSNSRHFQNSKNNYQRKK